MRRRFDGVSVGTRACQATHVRPEAPALPAPARNGAA
jgi:hypothetical protein